MNHFFQTVFMMECYETFSNKLYSANIRLIDGSIVYFSEAMKYYDGNGVDQNYHEVLRYFNLSGRKGNASALFTVGYFYKKRLGFPQNYTEAMKYYQWPSFKGSAEAQFFIPGFSDSHIHATQYSFAAESRFKEIACAEKVYNKDVQRTINFCSTTASYLVTLFNPSSQKRAEICKKKGERTFIGKVSMDSNSPPNHIEATNSDSKVCPDVYP
jgi:TPR repeat protein